MMLIIKRLFLCMVVLGSSLLQGMRDIPVDSQRVVQAGQQKISKELVRELQLENKALLEVIKNKETEIENQKRFESSARQFLNEDFLDIETLQRQRTEVAGEQELSLIQKDEKQQRERLEKAIYKRNHFEVIQNIARTKLKDEEAFEREDLLLKFSQDNPQKIQECQRVNRFRIFGFPPLAALTGGAIAESHNPGITASSARRFAQGTSSIRPSFGMPSFASGRFTSGLSTGSFRMPSFASGRFAQGWGAISSGGQRAGSALASGASQFASEVKEVVPVIVPLASVGLLGVTAYDAFCYRNTNDSTAVERARRRKWLCGISAGLGLMSLYLNRENLGNGLEHAVEHHPNTVINTFGGAAVVAGTAAVGAAGYGVKKCVDVVRGFNPFRGQNNRPLVSNNRPLAPQATEPVVAEPVVPVVPALTAEAVEKSLLKTAGQKLHNKQIESSSAFLRGSKLGLTEKQITAVEEQTGLTRLTPDAISKIDISLFKTTPKLI